MSRAEVLVTGFGPFPGVAHNLSGWLAQMLARTHGAKVMAAVLPVCWDGAWGALAPLLEEVRPRHVILFGVSHATSGFQLEQCAYNTASGQADAHGRCPPDNRLIPHGPAMREASLPARKIAAAMTGVGLPVEISSDPGRYLCNATLYRTLDWAAQNGTARAGFIHIPAGIAENSSAGPGLSAGDLLTGARLIVDTVLRADWPKPRSVPSAP
jgi:pyroglutamyl-peptidase